MSARFVSHMYWHRKERFLLARDRYPVWTLFAVEAGRFRYEIEGERGIAGPGMLVRCPPQAWFVRETLEPVSFHFFHYEEEALVEEAQSVEEAGGGEEERGSGEADRYADARLACRIVDGERLLTTYRYIHRVCDQEEPVRTSKLEHLLRDLLFLASESDEARTVETAQSSELADESMREAKRWLDAHVVEGAGLAALAEQLGLTPVQLTRRFRAAYDVTPQAYATELKIREAGRLLAGSRLTLHEIAARCGYENGYYLSRVFRQQTGLSPTQYRRRYQL
ncbi:hypothetical protein PA598K_03523 [Paenibacillus sp. 598K]|uniref:helix-turn-helix domain-containing protein n=1 Tax=Paenibacillus sp. 598K TaxID=1117987 RepID=UPI000FF92FDA|nr:AraC family transcriptional regulator [Paenibacillus sp. 598K]GBF75138.1 hypothetical protein PA598K_03523 [Paenibacillus sp. 598K]